MNYSNGIILTRSKVSLAELIRSKESDTVIFHPLVKEITWIEETESTYSLCYKGKTLMEYSTINDYYGYKQSIKGAVDEATKLKKSYGIEDNSGLELEVYMVVKRYPVTLAKEPNKKDRIQYNEIGDSLYINMENDLTELQSLLKMPFEERTSDNFDKISELTEKTKLKMIELAPIKVWSSLNGYLVKEK